MVRQNRWRCQRTRQEMPDEETFVELAQTLSLRNDIGGISIAFTSNIYTWQMRWGI